MSILKRKVKMDLNYSKDKMKKMYRTDALVRFVVNDLINRGHGEDNAYEIVFNSYVVGDVWMEEAFLGANPVKRKRP